MLQTHDVSRQICANTTMFRNDCSVRPRTVFVSTNMENHHEIEIREEESRRHLGRHLGDIWETSGRHPGDIWETFGRHLRDIWETSGKHLGDIWGDLASRSD